MLGVPKVAPTSAGAVVSSSEKLRIVLGPLFVTLIRYSTAAPATGSPLVRVFTTARSASGNRIVVSVAVLFVGFGSVNPGGAATVEVFESVPRAVPRIIAVTVKVAVPPAARFTVWFRSGPAPPMGPEPPA